MFVVYHGSERASRCRLEGGTGHSFPERPARGTPRGPAPWAAVL